MRRALLKELNGETEERRFLKMLGKNFLDAEKDAPLLIQLLLLDHPPSLRQPAADNSNNLICSSTLDIIIVSTRGEKLDTISSQCPMYYFHR